MATYNLISSSTVGSGGASSVTFSSIPSSYTDLVVQVSARSTESDNGSSLRFYFNGDTGNILGIELRAIGSSIASYTISNAQVGYVGASQSRASSFGSATLYVPNYRSSNVKLSSGDVALSSATTTENYLVMSIRSWAVTDAVTSVTLLSGIGNWVQYSTFCLYGISNS
jgi:hypothetical protein